MIQDVHIEKAELHFREPFQIAYEKVDRAPIIMVVLRDDKGNIGIGSAAPDEEVSGENIDRLAAALRKKIQKRFFSRPEEDWKGYRGKIIKALKQYPSGRAAVETALLYLAALRGKTMPQQFFGSCRTSCDVVVTVGIKGIAETRKEIEGRLGEGFRTIKLKCGLDPDGDVEKIHMAREIIPKSKQLLLDANQGYSLNDARRVLKAIRGIGVAGIEQPVSASDHEGLKSLRALDIIPIVVDEGARTKEEAFSLLKRGYADGINVKMMKYGGPSVCAEIVEFALAHSKIVILGCMYESNVSITAAAYLALAYPVQFVDLDSGHLDFDDDPTVGGVRVKDGALTIRGVPRLRASSKFRT